MEKRNDPLSNIQRVLTLLDKAINRLRRQNYFFRSQQHPLFEQIEHAILTTKSWIQDFRIFASLNNFFIVLGICIKNLSEMINLLAERIKPVPGKKQNKKSRQEKDRRNIFNAVDSMLDHIAQLINNSKPKETEISIKLEQTVLKAFEVHCAQKIKKYRDDLVSKRGDKTYIFPWDDPDQYEKLLGDRKKFKSLVMQYLEQYAHPTGHGPACSDHSRYRLCGSRTKPRTTVMPEGKKNFPIRMVQCLSCGQKFSLVPSFLPREKNFCLDIMGQVFENMLRFSVSIQGAMQSLKIVKNPVKSKQTILNWLRWMGMLHPATILTRAGITGSGYLQEDEGFEKEPDLRTYSVVLVDPQNMLVWHSDYVDSVDEQTLVSSFEKFIEKIEFKILGVTKDKWLASTKAVKTVFKNIWIGFCHRHYLKKLYQDLKMYQQQTNCDQKTVSALYQKIKKIIKTSSSEKALKIRLNALEDEAFEHPILKKRIEALKNDAVHYTSSKRRKAIAPTTSIVDNFLKMIKRKLTQVESFRDPEYTRFTFRAIGNVRNFLPFLSGAKNAHKSPFMLADGETFDLPWIQTMNVHNAFLFTENAC